MALPIRRAVHTVICTSMQKEDPLRTTLDLDRSLLERARQALRARSFTEAIESALREAVARAEGRQAWEALVGSEMSWGSIEELLDHRRRFGGRAL